MEVVFYSVIATTIWFFLSYASPCADNPVFDQTPDTPAEASGISASNGHFKAREEEHGPLLGYGWLLLLQGQVLGVLRMPTAMSCSAQAWCCSQ
eukprot:1159531-Pelagomonas_calceolata.AAC.9